MHYLRGWFFIDLVSTVPFDHIAMWAINIYSLVRGVRVRLYMGLCGVERVNIRVHVFKTASFVFVDHFFYRSIRICSLAFIQRGTDVPTSLVTYA